jgi:hypothetical protein
MGGVLTPHAVDFDVLPVLIHALFAGQCVNYFSVIQCLDESRQATNDFMLLTSFYLLCPPFSSAKILPDIQ